MRSGTWLVSLSEHHQCGSVLQQGEVSFSLSRAKPTCQAFLGPCKTSRFPAAVFLFSYTTSSPAPRVFHARHPSAMAVTLTTPGHTACGDCETSSVGLKTCHPRPPRSARATRLEPADTIREHNKGTACIAFASIQAGDFAVSELLA